MRITIDISGYYDWIPVPADVEITDADVRALRVKQMTSDEWRMRVSRPSPDAGQQHTMGVHEEAIARLYASAEANGAPLTREECVERVVRESVRHHLHRSHIVEIHVDDDGPDADVVRVALAAAGLSDEDAVGRYCETGDVADHLNRALQAGAYRKGAR